MHTFFWLKKTFLYKKKLGLEKVNKIKIKQMLFIKDFM